MSGERIRLRPDATPDEAEAVRQALAALGLIEPDPAAEVSRDRDVSPPPTDRGLSP